MDFDAFCPLLRFRHNGAKKYTSFSSAAPLSFPRLARIQYPSARRHKTIPSAIKERASGVNLLYVGQSLYARFCYCGAVCTRCLLKNSMKCTAAGDAFSMLRTTSIPTFLLSNQGMFTVQIIQYACNTHYLRNTHLIQR